MATKSRLTQLQDFQLILDELWRSKRWIMNVVTFARDKQSVNGVPLHQISQCLTNNDLALDEESVFQIPIINLNSPSYESPPPTPPPNPGSRRPSRDDSVIDTNYFNDQLKINSSSSSYSFIDSLYFMNSDYKSETYSPKSYEDMRRCVSASKIDGPNRANRIRDQTRTHNLPITTTHLSDQCIANLKDQANQNSTEWVPTDSKSESQELFDSTLSPNSNQSVVSSTQVHLRVDQPESAHLGLGFSQKQPMVRIYIGYDCGLPFGTSVKIQITEETTVRQIIECVVNHLNSMVCLREKTGSVYDSSDLNKFCVIAVFSSEVKHLNDDFRIANLQTPWNRSKICIKFKDNVL